MIQAKIIIHVKRDLGAYIRAWRVIKCWSQCELAEKAGVSRHTISHIERGQVQPTLKILVSVLGALGLELELVVKEVGNDG